VALRHEEDKYLKRKKGLRWSAGALCAALIAGAGIGLTETTKLGIFTDEGSVGQTPPGQFVSRKKGLQRRHFGTSSPWGHATNQFP
jgi:hypothetical protein